MACKETNFSWQWLTDSDEHDVTTSAEVIHTPKGEI